MTEPKFDETEEELIKRAKELYIKDTKEELERYSSLIENYKKRKEEAEKELIEKEEEFKRIEEENKRMGKESEMCEDIIRKLDPDDFFLKKSLVHFMIKNKPTIFSNKIILQERIINCNELIANYEKLKEELFSKTFY